ncbi:MAG: radical SAM family heme chaperone HemW [Anaerolineae bacterium]|nr:radical SAM family heme chaperone HemW [Anaerolineae bacterium]
MTVALYIHVPFCVRRCTYCDFNTYAGLLPLRSAYVAALQHELQARATHYGRLPVATIYFGGGTPSLLAPEDVAAVLNTVQTQFQLVTDAEITLEVNPGTVGTAMLEALRRAGVNRLSLGIQSTFDDELQMLGRIHTWTDAQEVVQYARAVGFTNLSLDLIYGLPGQSMERWQSSLERIIILGPQHLSLYALKLEPGTPLEVAVTAGKYPSPDEDLAADMYEWASERLRVAGFWQYEISNWAQGMKHPPTVWAVPPTGRAEGISPWVARHNLVYWRTTPWLGIGAGAYSWIDHRRFSNPPHPKQYIAWADQGIFQAWESESISPPLERAETMIMALRLAEGITARDFRARFGEKLTDVYTAPLVDLSELGLLEWDGERARLSTQGRLLGNHVFAEFLP